MGTSAQPLTMQGEHLKQQKYLESQSVRNVLKKMMSLVIMVFEVAALQHELEDFLVDFKTGFSYLALHEFPFVKNILEISSRPPKLCGSHWG